MLTEYIEEAMARAVYEKLKDSTYSGTIPPCEGTVALGDTLYECQNELRSVLEGWLIVKIRHGDHIPVVGKVNINKGIPSLKEMAKHG